jgi:NitT/TauT family transport system permease protein
MSVTMMRVLVGFSCALALSLAIGIAMGVWRSVETFLEPGVLIGLTIPALCWTAIAVMLLGLGEGPAIFSIIVLVTPMITVNVLAGMKALDRQLIEMAKAFGANRRVILREVVFPQLLPYVLAGSRYGLGLSWKVVVIAEMMGLSSGIGYQIAFSYGMFSLAKVFAWTVSFSAVMFGIEYGLMRPLEKRWTKWQVRAAI